MTAPARLSRQPAEPAAAVASHRIADQLREQILCGHLLPGDRIRQEDIAEQLGVSRIPVREALRTLEAQGLVDLKANSGAWVSKMDLKECQAIYKIRERLEPLALSESIPNLDAATVDRIDEIQLQIESDLDVDNFLLLDRELHLLTYSGNQIDELNVMIDRFWNTTQHYRRAFVRLTGPTRRWVVNSEHRLLLDAIRRRDVVDGQQVLTTHIRRTRVALADHPELFVGSPTA